MNKIIKQLIDKVVLCFYKIRDKLVLIILCKNWLEISFFILEKKSIKLVLRNGIQMQTHKNSVPLIMIDEILFRKVYNPANLSIESNDIVVDIGACFGVFALFAARKTKNTVFALEPHPENFELLSRNIQTNRFKNIIAYKVAISYGVTSKKFYMTSIKEGSTLDNHNIFGTLNKYIEVPAVSLSEFMDNNNLGRIDFLKIDVEGYEDVILMSTPRNYLSRIRKIAMEFHNVGQLKHEKIQKYMENIGFTTKLNWDGKSPFGYLYCWRR